MTEEIIPNPLITNFVAVSLAEDCGGTCEGFALTGVSTIDWGHLPEPYCDVTVALTLDTPVVE